VFSVDDSTAYMLEELLSEWHEKNKKSAGEERSSVFSVDDSTAYMLEELLSVGHEKIRYRRG
jgi:hypothetical protein